MGDLERRRDNIVEMFRRASEDEILEGKAWYAETHNWCQARADEYGLTLETVAAIVAVLSPLQAWTQNKKSAKRVLATGSAVGCGLKSNCRKAEAILRGAAPLDVLNGDKVLNFYQNIITGGENDGATIDRHAVSIAEGREVGDAERGKLLRTKRQYADYVEAYRAAALILGIHVAMLQAITWVAWRNTLKGRAR